MKAIAKEIKHEKSVDYNVPDLVMTDRNRLKPK